MNNEKVSSFKQSYNITLDIAGKSANIVKRSFLFFIFAYVFQGLAFTLFFPLLNNIFSKEFNLNETLFYLVIIAIFSIVSFILDGWVHSFNTQKILLK